MMRLPGNIVLTAIGITVDSMTLTPLAENLPVANVNVVMFGKGTPRKILLENTEALFSGILLEIEITTVLPEVRTVILGVARRLARFANARSTAVVLANRAIRKDAIYGIEHMIRQHKTGPDASLRINDRELSVSKTGVAEHITHATSKGEREGIFLIAKELLVSDGRFKDSFTATRYLNWVMVITAPLEAIQPSHFATGVAFRETHRVNSQAVAISSDTSISTENADKVPVRKAFGEIVLKQGLTLSFSFSCHVFMT
jgi:hypothetical protein